MHRNKGNQTFKIIKENQKENKKGKEDFSYKTDRIKILKQK